MSKPKWTREELDDHLADFLKNDPDERAALHRSMSAVLTELDHVRKAQDLHATDVQEIRKTLRKMSDSHDSLRVEVRGIEARVTILEQGPIKTRSIPPMPALADFGREVPKGLGTKEYPTGSFIITPDGVEKWRQKRDEEVVEFNRLQKLHDNEVKAGRYDAAMSGTWKIVLAVVTALALTVAGLLGFTLLREASQSHTVPHGVSP
jgi:hypothetical protein